jgi:hypothetical protein
MTERVEIKPVTEGLPELIEIGGKRQIFLGLARRYSGCGDLPDGRLYFAIGMKSDGEAGRARLDAMSGKAVVASRWGSYEILQVHSVADMPQEAPEGASGADTMMVVSALK